MLGGNLVERPLPEVTGEREHVRLVHQRALLARPGTGEIEREADAPLDTHTRVDRALRRDLLRRSAAQEAPLAGVCAFRVLAHDQEIDAVVVAARAGLERSQVDVEVEREAHLQQQPAFEDPRRHLGRPDRAEQDRVVCAQLVEDGIGEHFTGSHIPPAAEVVGRCVECDPGGAHDVQRDRRHLGADAVAADDPDPMGHKMSLHEKTAHTGVDGEANAGGAPAYGMTITEKCIDMRPSGYTQCDLRQNPIRETPVRSEPDTGDFDSGCPGYPAAS